MMYATFCDLPVTSLSSIPTKAMATHRARETAGEIKLAPNRDGRSMTAAALVARADEPMTPVALHAPWQ
jgi:hypothetical protein